MGMGMGLGMGLILMARSRNALIFLWAELVDIKLKISMVFYNYEALCESNFIKILCSLLKGSDFDQKIVLVNSIFIEPRKLIVWIMAMMLMTPHISRRRSPSLRRLIQLMGIQQTRNTRPIQKRSFLARVILSFSWDVGCHRI